MDADLAEMLDHHRIRKVLARYCRATDRADEAGMAAVYAEDSWDDHGTVKATGADFSRIMCRQIEETTDTLTHSLGQSLITVRGDEAGAETYFTAIVLQPGADGTPVCGQLGGRFVDRLVREADGQWKISRRTVLRDWSIALPVTTDWELSRTLTPGCRSINDPSYAVLGDGRGDCP